ncbi:hypothetical protein [Ferruginibacter sp.]
MKYFLSTFLFAGIMLMQPHLFSLKENGNTSFTNTLKTDTSYVSIQVFYQLSKKGRHINTTASISASTSTAPVIANGISKVLKVESPTTANKTLLNTLLKGRVISKKYADAYTSLTGDISYSLASDNTKEVGNGIAESMGLTFIVQFSDDDADPTITSIGGGVKTVITIGNPDGEPPTIKKGEQGVGFGGMNIPGDRIGNAAPVNASNGAHITVAKSNGSIILKGEKKYTEDGEDGGVTTVESFTAVIGTSPQRYVAIIKPVEEGDLKYQQWLPDGPATDGEDDTKGNNKLKFTISVRDKNDPSAIYPGNFTVKWILKDVTSYPGFCNNYPAYSENPDVSNDLVFDPSLKSNPNFEPGDDPSSISSKPGNGAGAVVQVMCMDYAAWGKLTAIVTLDDNSFPITANPYYDNKSAYLTIPYDRDENKLADAWESANAVFRSGHPLTWDADDNPKQQRDQGDGYTLFEEYRGFAVFNPSDATPLKQFIHIRTNPNYKDAFINDPDKLFKENYEADNPSDLNWHYLSLDKNQFYYPDELDIEKPLSRWVNFNKVADYFYSEQYCLMIMYSHIVYPRDKKMTGCSYTKQEWDAVHMAQPLSEGDEFVFNEGTAPDYTTKSPVKKFLKIEIYIDAIRAKFQFVKQERGDAAFKDAVAKKVSRTVKHEIGHCIGIHHHLPPAGATAALDHDEIDIKESDGLTSCVMRYFTDKENKDIDLLLSDIKTYCKKEGTGPFYYLVFAPTDTDKQGPYTENYGGTKQADNCFGQISIKSRPEDTLLP